MALPSVHVYLLAEAENLRHAVDPRVVLLQGAERIRDAPAMKEVLQSKLNENTGWSIENMPQLHRAARLHDRLVILRNDILPALIHNPKDASTLRRLIGQAQAIRRIGTKSKGHLRTLAVGLGNRLRTAGEKVQKDPGWLADRISAIQFYAKKVHDRYYIPFLSPGEK